ncbi:plasmid pRiA4b ORF-3 family protein [Paraflavisolibacter sp. H34]|uniref:plasmid pRiA4b ORF-3 family protein n=1 Tax=Huijunlia imazamoxiresistens TaxID=3127457 RepID=UPI0030178C36
MALQFKIQLLEVDNPPVWRRVVIPEHFTFMRFHHVIQEAFGWENSHLFLFSPEGWGSEPSIGMVNTEDPDDNTLDSKKIKLSRVFKKEGQTYTYIYNMGDDWLHGIWLEKITEEKLLKADCLDGSGKCPPEDCGGSPGFEDFKRTMADPKHPEHKELKEWLGLSKRQKWNPEEFHLKKTQSAVRAV